ncbi:MAG TPA: 50S ribosomal protein L29 [candidate division WWE3 bacterium]|uniref:Large ribosomal subunit protein uL29 n=1 Tax=candidate division WWE3 bacterium TaxID=2053526 RepID=A0A7V5MI27_UNCKA|nr:50S ribosomal protein L29 [candidate division WWE3 bacterium]
MLVKELREKSIKELYKILRDSVKELQVLTLNLKIGKSSDIKTKRLLKKKIARIKTVIKEKEVLKNEKA